MLVQNLAYSVGDLQKEGLRVASRIDRHEATIEPGQTIFGEGRAGSGEG